MKGLEQLPSGSYRYRKQIDGVNVRITFDHRPTEKELMLAIAKKYPIAKRNITNQSFEVCCVQFVTAKSNVLSPSTIRTYTIYTNKTLSAALRDVSMAEVDSILIQNEINSYAKNHAPKTVHNYHAFLSEVLKEYRPDLNLNTTLPKVPRYNPYVLSENEVKDILEASRDTKYHIPFQLGVLSLRRSEVCALTVDDVKNNILSVNKGMVMDKDDNWVIKHITKSEDGMREIVIPQKLSDEIKERGVIYDGAPITLLHALNRFEKKLGIPKTRFHDLRVFYATYAHSMGIPDAVILSNGGWRSEYTMKRVYRKAMEEDKRKYQIAYNEILI